MVALWGAGSPRGQAPRLLMGKAAQVQRLEGLLGLPGCLPDRGGQRMVKLPRVSEIQNRRQGCPTFRLPLP